MFTDLMSARLCDLTWPLAIGVQRTREVTSAREKRMKKACRPLQHLHQVVRLLNL